MKRVEHEIDVSQLLTDEGQLERPFPSGHLGVYENVSIRNGCVRFRGSRRLVSPGDRMLLDFARLHAQPRQAFVRFAAKWGPLGLCDVHPLEAYGHRCDWKGMILPRAWEIHREGMKLPPALEVRSEKRNLGLFVNEPFEAWERASRSAAELLGIANQLEMLKLQSSDTRPRVDPRPPVEGVLFGAPAPAKLADQLHLDLGVNAWLHDGGVRPRFTSLPIPEEGGSRVTMEGNALYGALAVQLLLAVTKLDGIWICDNCGDFYVPTKHPREGEHHFCAKEECARRAAWRKAQERQRHGTAKPRQKQGESDEQFQERRKDYERRMGSTSTE
jgi:hypothetical protein